MWITWIGRYRPVCSPVMRRPRGRGRREAICPRDDLSPNVTRVFCGSRADIQRGRMFPDVRLMVAATFALGRGVDVRIWIVRRFPRQPRAAWSRAAGRSAVAARHRQCGNTRGDNRAGGTVRSALSDRCRADSFGGRERPGGWTRSSGRHRNIFNRSADGIDNALRCGTRWKFGYRRAG